jgi:hypothetical protein
MQRFCVGMLAVFGFFLLRGIEFGNAEQKRAAGAPSVLSVPHIDLRSARESTSDLEVGGDLRGLPPRATRYLTREALLALPQVTYTVTDDSNFTGPTEISGVPLEELTRSLGRAPKAELVVAICDDKYRANYPPDYVAAHHPLLALTIGGQPPGRRIQRAMASTWDPI